MTYEEKVLDIVDRMCNNKDICKGQREKRGVMYCSPRLRALCVFDAEDMLDEAIRRNDE